MPGSDHDRKLTVAMPKAVQIMSEEGKSGPGGTREGFVEGLDGWVGWAKKE